MIKFLIDDRTVFSVIILNTLAIFLNAFPELSGHAVLVSVEYASVGFFLLEIVLKIRTWGFRNYWASAWNRFDFIVVITSSGLLLYPFLDSQASFLSILRLSRFIRLLKFLYFIPNRRKMAAGIIRALKASVGVVMVLVFLNFMLGMGATYLFGQRAPEHFGNPLLSVYTLFKVFTIEGWYEVPDQLSAEWVSGFHIVLLRSYFIFAVVVGGILGLSLANAIFVDEMTADNTQKAEDLLVEIRGEIQSLRGEVAELKHKQK